MNELSIQTCFKFVGIGVNCRQCRIIVTVCGATNKGRLFRWTIFLHIFFSSEFCLNKIRDGVFRIFVYPTMFVTVGGATNEWREGRG